MNRRQFLATAGAAGATSVLAGCLGDDGYETLSTGGQEVPLAPVEDTYEWYQNDAVFLDARRPAAYVNVRIEGALLSPANSPDFDHPTADLSTDQRIVTYCTCPHSLSSARAAELMAEGFENVYAIDEGLNGWRNNGYPTASGPAAAPKTQFFISGQVDPAYAGDQIWLEEQANRQHYVTLVDDDGGFEMDPVFYDVDRETPARLTLPDRTVERPLGDLEDGQLSF
ncbi:rhodanese-like domain-containing protein [Halovivax limisalsi]|uniref:rhodanese-like domain-containing protein n=1 Tax=Halovivax limisalsi TaxID=1453760 RepID=UPI001FFDDB57|nr:rhodanese-like domain-containing protein [Halovivax limisalsi]